MASLFMRDAQRPLRVWWLLSMTLACTLGTQELDAPDSSGPRADASEPVPTPLIEVEVAELDPTPRTEPEPEVEPHPFSDEQLERIAAVQGIVTAAAADHGVDPGLINGLIWVESKFERRARGPAGAQGLMQLMPKTAAAMAKRLGRKRNSYDPDFNIHAGTLLLSRLIARFDGDVSLALAGYNRGGGTVSKWVAAGEPLPEGLQNFIERVLTARGWFERMPPPRSTP